MKKITRLTERDLTRLVKKILKEDMFETLKVSDLTKQPYLDEGGRFKIMTNGIKLEFDSGKGVIIKP